MNKIKIKQVMKNQKLIQMKKKLIISKNIMKLFNNLIISKVIIIQILRTLITSRTSQKRTVRLKSTSEENSVLAEIPV